MCGIIGITRSLESNGFTDTIGQQIYDALTRLEYRGYDSVGMAIVTTDGIDVKKDRGPIRKVGKELKFPDYSGHTAIGHSRWATHGIPNQSNAHPHVSSNDVVVVHNGIIENYIGLRKELIEEGYEFQSQTDTETIPHFLSLQLKLGKSMPEAIQILVNRIEGTYAIVIAHTREPDKIYALKKDNPLVIGVSEHAMFCASDIPAFLPWTNEVVTLRDNELVILTPEGYEINSLEGEKIQREPHKVTWTAEAAQKGGYPHFMLKEIHEQPKVIATQLSTQTDIFQTIGKVVNEASKVIVVAAGTAHYASLNAYYTFSQFGGPLVIPCVAAEWDAVKHLVDENTVVMAVSQSGETLDTIKPIKDAKSRGATIVSIVNVAGSSLTQFSDYIAYIHAGPEIGVAATKTFTAQSVAVWRIAYELAKLNNALDKDELNEFQNAFDNLSSVANQIIRVNEAKARDLAKWFSTKSSAFYLGRNLAFVSALEGALKMKEIAYIHCEAYPAGESKHGPIALIVDDYPVVFTIPNDKTRTKMIGSVQEMSARGAYTIGIIEEGDVEMKSMLDQYFEIPKGYSKFLSSIIYTIPQQLMAYYTSVVLGNDPDYPANLAKVVTVE
ncbi:MAG: Glutamine--fructose-6-phosphate aminotransferase [isomerizing] [Candidatus Heimdallarchaeota archaeon LC_2]|nr:MAG: Glutamine--fructose-6-phosphate aminotransferase [isomerizing] [Candidatus Heimdallarchaeota archaeon LC_2]